MENKNLYLLLKTVKENKNLNLLLREGLTFKRIGELNEIAAKENFLELVNEKITLTELGVVQLEAWEKEFKKTNKKDWIIPHIQSRISNIDKNDIFLPSQDELSF